MSSTLLQFECFESPVTHSEKNTASDDPQFLVFKEKQAERQADCKTGWKVSPVFNEHDNSLSFGYEPHICGSPLCEKCLPERKALIKDHYRPFFKYGTVKPFVGHLIFSYPSFPRTELATRLPKLIKQTSNFFMLVRKSYGYYFKAVVLVEPHYQPDTETYNFHLHAGIFTYCDKEQLKALWDRAFNGDFIVKYPIDPKTGKTKYRVKKYAFLNYIAKRRSQQALTVPLEDFYFSIMNHQLIRRIGFTKRNLALISRIRKENSCLPDGFVALRPFFIPKEWNFEWFKDRFRTHFEAIRLARGDISTLKAMSFHAYLDTKDDYENPQIQKPVGGSG